MFCFDTLGQIETRLVNHLLEIFDECDTDKDNKINFQEWEKMAGIMRSKFPLAEKHFTQMFVPSSRSPSRSGPSCSQVR